MTEKEPAPGDRQSQEETGAEQESAAAGDQKETQAASAGEEQRTSTPEGTDKRAQYATTGMVLGIIDLLAWLLPILGIPLGVLALVFATKGKNSEHGSHAMVGIVTAIIGLVLGVANAAVGAYMAVAG
jgi:thiol:disulfide interchange protein